MRAIAGIALGLFAACGWAGASASASASNAPIADADAGAAGRAHSAPILQQIAFRGNALLSSQTLSRSIGLRIGDRATREAIDGALAGIAAAYRAAGGSASLGVQLSPVDATHARIEFIIDESGSAGRGVAGQRSGARSGGVPPPPPPETRQ